MSESIQSNVPQKSHRYIEVVVLPVAPAGTYVKLDAMEALSLLWPQDKQLIDQGFLRSHPESGWFFRVDHGKLVVENDQPVIRSFFAKHDDYGHVVCDEDGTILATTTMAYPQLLKSAHCNNTSTPNEARKKLHDAGWDYWVMRRARAIENDDKAEIELCTKQMEPLLPLLTQDVDPRPIMHGTCTQGQKDIWKYTNFYPCHTHPHEVQTNGTCH